MASKLEWLSDFFYKIAYWTASTLLISIFLIMVLQVFCRSIGEAFSWPEEIVLVFFPWMVFLGASMVLKEREHIGIDFVVNLFPIRLRNIVLILTDIMIVSFSGYLLIFGWKLSVFVGAKQTSTFWDIPYFYLYLSTCAGGAFLLIQGVILTLQDMAKLFGPNEK
jgi:TRAP-type C4-dicarboxylate transport system permease small subunit